MADVSLSELDSRRFSIRAARWRGADRADLPDVLAFCDRHSVEFLIARCDAAEVRTAQAIEDVGGRLMDTLVHYVRELPTPGLPAAGASHRVRVAGPEEADAVRRVAAAAFRDYHGHYHADPRLDPARADEVYADWAYRACLDRAQRGGGRDVLVGETSGRIAGFLVLERGRSAEAEIVLNAVEPSQQRRGLYRDLLIAALRRAADSGVRLLTVSTQLGNIAPQRAWLSVGFSPQRAEHTFHVWL